MLNDSRSLVYKQAAFRSGLSDSKIQTSKTLKIAFFTHNLRSQGAQRSLLEIATKINQYDRYQSVLFTPGHGELEYHYTRQGVQVIIYSRLNSKEPFTNDYLARKSLLENALRDHNIDIIHANTLQTYDIVVAASELSIPVIWNIRESDDPSDIKNGLSDKQNTIFDKAFEVASRVVFVSTSSKDIWLNTYPRIRSKVIPNSLRWDNLSKLSAMHNRDSFRAALNVSASEKIILTTGTVSERKGQMDIIDTIETNHSILNNSILIIAGLNGTNYSNKLREKVHSLKVRLSNRIYLFNERPFEEIVPFYVSADIFVFCSRLESFPRTILEAFFFGLPVITTPVNGIPEFVSSGINGLFYQPGNINDLESKLFNLISVESLYRKLRKNAFEQKRYHWQFDQLVDEYIKCYADAIA